MGSGMHINMILILPIDQVLSHFKTKLIRGHLEKPNSIEYCHDVANYKL